jgi:hypothetical protein
MRIDGWAHGHGRDKEFCIDGVLGIIIIGFNGQGKQQAHITRMAFKNHLFIYESQHLSSHVRIASAWCNDCNVVIEVLRIHMQKSLELAGAHILGHDLLCI